MQARPHAGRAGTAQIAPPSSDRDCPWRSRRAFVWFTVLLFKFEVRNLTQFARLFVCSLVCVAL